MAPRGIGGRLTPAQISAAKKRPGRYADGANLYLAHFEGGSVAWEFRYKKHWMGLGPLRDVSPTLARAKARDLRELLRNGQDPLVEKRERIAAAKREGVTFEDASRRFVEAHRDAWSPKNILQWQSQLAAHILPVLGRKSVAKIDTPDVLSVVEPIWKTRSETADRCRMRVMKVIDWSVSHGLRKAGPNPAQWKGHLQNLLPKLAKIAPTKHLAALPWRKAPAFMAALRQREGTADRALEFVVLTVPRTNEALGARWDEVDFDAATWTISSDRMKTREPHTVPLTGRALALLAGLPRNGDLIFPNTAGRQLDPKSLRAVLADMKVACTVHGFRSSFRDFAGDATTFPREIAEAALAHKIGNSTEQAYRRSDALDRRRALMTAWSDYLDGGREPVKLTVVSGS